LSRPPPEPRRAAPSARRAWLRATELVLLTSGLALLGVYAAARLHTAVAQATALDAFAVAQAANGARDAQASNRAAALADPGEPDQSLWDQRRIAAYRASLAVGATPLGVLEVPKIGLRAAVFEGTGTLALNRGVGRIEGTASLGAVGNVGIAGHRDGFFRGLKSIAIGDEIEVQSLEGTIRYRVTETLIVAPDDVYVLAPTDGATLTLVTCYPFYVVGDAPQRFIVKAVAAS
jgi:sortase A